MIWIGLDDTDMPGSPGTGRLAREIAGRLGERFPLFGVTRHQLLQDPRVPMTARNSAAVIHLEADGAAELEEMAWLVGRWVMERAAPGSDPGLCLAWQVPASVMAFGRKAKETLVTLAEAHILADQAGLILRGLGGDGSGAVGALAAVGLAASGEDGRFILRGRLRELEGLQPVPTLLAAGVARVQAVDGQLLTEGMVDTRGRLRPSLVGGEPVLWVRRESGRWVAMQRD